MRWRRRLKSLSLRPSWAICKHEFRVMRSDLETPIFLIVIPLLMTAFMKPLFRMALVGEGFAGANGSEQAVPGMAVMFSTMFVGYMGFAFFRDHGWGTWERLRASPASPLQIMVGKLLPPFAVSILQLVVLFSAGVLAFDLVIRGSTAALVLVSGALTLALLSFGVAVTAIARTSQQLDAWGGMGGLLFAMLGGSLVPVSVLPGWARWMAPATPTYWAMEGYRSVLLTTGGLGDVLFPVIALLGFAVAFTVVAVVKFRFDETKVYWG